MVRPYNSAKHAHNVLVHAHLPPPTRRFIFLEPLSLSPNNLVAAVTLENEALLYAFFIVFAAIKARVFARDLL